MRVVLDTNVVVSALVFPGGPASDALARVVDGRDVLVTSKPLIHDRATLRLRAYAGIEIVDLRTHLAST